MAKKRIWTWILLPVIVCAVIALGEAWFLRDVLALPERGVESIAITEDSVSVDGGEEWAEEEFDEEYDEEYDEEWDEEGEWAAEVEQAFAGVIDIPAGGTAQVAHEGYVHYLTVTGQSKASDGRYTVSGTDAQGEGFAVTSFLGGDGVDTLYLGREVTGLAITVADAGCTLTALQVDNSLRVNPLRMLFFGLCALAVYLLVALRDVIARKAEIGYLILAACVGVYLCVALPANTGVSYDDGVHFSRIQLLSRGKTTGLTAAENSLTSWDWTVIYDNGYHHIWDTWDDQLRYAEMTHEAATSSNVDAEQIIQFQFSDVGYATQALGALVARVLRLPILWQVRVIRMFNMLTYLALTYLAVRTLKRFKLTMACTALMPSALFTACNFSYDTTTNALCFLGVALAVDAILDRRTLLTRKRALGILLCLLIGAMSKVVYMPLLLLVLLLPRGKFESAAARRWFKAAGTVICIAAVGAMVMSVSTGAVGLQDSRAEGADSAAQIAYLISHPLAYLGTFFKVILRDWGTYFVQDCRFQLGYLAEMAPSAVLLCLCLTLFTAFTDNDTSLMRRMNWKLRLGMLIIAGLAVGMVFTTMYVAGAPVGATEYWGVQGRYMIPVMPLLLMLLSPDGVHHRMNKTGWHMTFFLLQGVVLASMCWGSVYAAYWL